MSAILASCNNDNDAPTSMEVPHQHSATIVPCRAAPLPDQDGPRGHSINPDRSLASATPLSTHQHVPFTTFGYGFALDEVMDGLSDDENDCQSPVRNYNAAPCRISYLAEDAVTTYSTTGDSIANHTAATNTGNYFDNLEDGDFAFYDVASDVDSMVDLSDRSYEHLFEELTVIAVDDYNNSYYVQRTPVAVAAQSQVYQANTEYDNQWDAAVQVHVPQPQQQVEPSYYYSSASYRSDGNGYAELPHSRYHSHSARNAALLHSANAKYSDPSGQYGWQWGLEIGDSEEEREEEQVWLRHGLRNNTGSDSVPCRDCCRCGCNEWALFEFNRPAAEPQYHQDFHHHQEQQLSQFNFTTSSHHQRQTRRNNPYSLGSYEASFSQQQKTHFKPQLTKTEQVMSLTGLSQEECEAKFPYRCGVKEFPARPTQPRFPSEELGVPYIKCCYYAQRPHKECSMGSKCYHTHDHEDGDLVPEAFADGRNRSELRSKKATPSKLTYADIVASQRAAAAANHDGGEIATVPQSVYGDDDDDDAHTTAAATVAGAFSEYHADRNVPHITRAQLASVPCQYGASCALPRHAAVANQCGFNAEKLKRYKAYIAELRQFTSLVSAYRRAKTDVRAEAAQLQQIADAAKAEARQQMKSHMRQGHQSSENTNFDWNISAQSFSPASADVNSDFAAYLNLQPQLPHRQPPPPRVFSDGTDLSHYTNTVPCLHCAAKESVTLKHVSVFRPNPRYDGFQDMRKEVKMHGIGAACLACGKTFAFDDERQFLAYVSQSHDRPCPNTILENHSDIDFNQKMARTATAVFDGDVVKTVPLITEAVLETYVEDLPW